MAQEREPRRPVLTRFLSEITRQDSPDNVLVDFDSEGARDDHRDLPTAESRVPGLDRDNRCSDFGRWAFRTGLRSSLWREQRLVLAPHQRTMKLQDRGRPDNGRNLGDSASPDEDGAETEKQSVKWSEARRPSAFSVEDEKLMSKREVFRDQGLGTAGAQKPNDGGHEQHDEARDCPHPGVLASLGVMRIGEVPLANRTKLLRDRI